MPASFFILCALIGGILFQSIVPCPQSILVFCGVITTLIALVCFFKTKNDRFLWALFLIATILIGAERYRFVWNSFETFHTDLNSKTCTFSGSITDIKETASPFTPVCITIKINNLTTASHPYLHAINKQILLYTRMQHDIRVDDIVTCKDIIFKSPPNKSFASFLIKNGAIATVFIPSVEMERIERPELSIKRLLFETKTNILCTVKQSASVPTATLFSSLFLGNREAEKTNNCTLSDNFKKWGIAHLIARSGIHLTLFIGAWHLILRVIPLPLLYKQLILFIMAILYHLLSWPSISFLRAFYTFLICRAIAAAGYAYSFLHILILVCIGLLISNPIDLFFLDFQLSFGLTCAIAWLNNQSYQ